MQTTSFKKSSDKSMVYYLGEKNGMWDTYLPLCDLQSAHQVAW